MPYPVTIGGEEITLAWDQQTARAYPYRAGRIGGAPKLRDLANAKRAVAAVTDLLWLFLPLSAVTKYPTPEELFLAIDHESHYGEIHAAVIGIVGEMTATPEKKRSLPNSPSPGSNSD